MSNLSGHAWFFETVFAAPGIGGAEESVCRASERAASP